ncbi:UNVERIFIED_CONTAM: hypothetical protein Sradi_5703500 [Sesamum radiatum]|uniref:Uncharacterized protein n=1 Tax=Sesamum radiatum TaxID=300843 RepID=A0AAW2L3P5_SESRA
MENSNNGGDNGSYEGNSSFLVVTGLAIPPTELATGTANALPSDLIVGANAPTPTLALDASFGLIAMNLLFCEQLR